jgi:hypothetical protein
MTLQADQISADGVTLQHLSCDLNGGGFMALMGVIASVSSQKTALTACDPAGGAFEVSWTWSNGKAGAVTVTNSSLPAKNRCVQAALSATTSGVDGMCKGTLLVGDPAAAERAAAALAPATVPTETGPLNLPVAPQLPEEPPKKKGIGI